MPYLGGSANDAFTQGQFHTVNDQHANFGSITLNDKAGAADQGLQDASDAWNNQVGQVATTARSVLAPYAFSRAASPNGTASQNYVPGFGSLGSGNGETPQTLDGNLTLRRQGDPNAEVD